MKKTMLLPFEKDSNISPEIKKYIDLIKIPENFAINSTQSLLNAIYFYDKDIKIAVKKNLKLQGEEVNGYYDSDTKRLVIDRQVMLDEIKKNEFSTVFHELAHRLQESLIINEYQKYWKNEEKIIQLEIEADTIANYLSKKFTNRTIRNTYHYKNIDFYYEAYLVNNDYVCGTRNLTYNDVQALNRHFVKQI